MPMLDTGRDIYDTPFPYYEKPVEIGSFSLNIDREFENSQSCLRYFVKPGNPSNVNFNLRKGYDKMIKKERISEFKIQHWILTNQEKMPTRDGKFDVNFVCGRGLLAKVLCTPYEEEENWMFGVTLHKGTYYLHEIPTNQYRKRQAELKDDEKCYWGYKFEQYLTSDTPGGVPDTDAVYNNCEAFYTVVKTKLRSHSLVFSGEVDARNVESPDAPYYMELKTNRKFDHEGNIKNFKRFKLKKWWAQSHVIGVQQIACGFRDDNGIVSKVRYYNTADLPNIASDIYDPWKSNVCLNFLDKFLTFIKNSIKTDDYRVVHILTWSPGHRVHCSEPLIDSEYSFLDQEFTQTI